MVNLEELLKEETQRADEATALAAAVDVGIRLSVVVAGFSLTEKMIQVTFDAMKEDLLSQYENPEILSRELENMRERVLMIHREIHRD